MELRVQGKGRGGEGGRGRQKGEEEERQGKGRLANRHTNPSLLPAPLIQTAQN